MAPESSIHVRVLQLGRRVVDVDTKPGQEVMDVLRAAGLNETKGMDLRVNGRTPEAGYTVRDGDVVTVIPRIKGGGRRD